VSIKEVENMEVMYITIFGTGIAVGMYISSQIDKRL